MYQSHNYTCIYVAIAGRRVQEAHRNCEISARRGDGPRPQTHHSEKTGTLSGPAVSLNDPVCFQWMDFSDSSQFNESCAQLLDAIQTLIGSGSGAEKYVITTCTHFS